MVTRVLIILAMTLTSCTSRVSEPTLPLVQPSNLPLLSPDYRWKAYFFPEISKRARVAKLPNLDAAIIPANDLEVRVWHGFGLILLEGLIIKRSAGQWSAMHLAPFSPKLPRGKHEIPLDPPKSGWDACLKRLSDAGLLTLPDASQLGKEPVDPDVLSYVVEYNDGGSYRTYHYTYPEANDHKQAKMMIMIGDIIQDEFHLPQFRTRM